MNRGATFGTRASFLVLAAFMALAGLGTPTQGGSAADPEITDPGDDGSFPLDPALGARDITAVWIDDLLVDLGSAGPGMRFNVQTAEDIDHFTGLLALHERMRISFVPTAGLGAGAVEAYVYIRPNLGTSADTGEELVSCRYGFASAAGGSQDINTEGTGTAAFAANLFSCGVPLSFLPGFNPSTGGKLTQLRATFELVARGPVSGNPATEPVAPRILATFDTAPNTGFGRDWPSAPPPTPPVGNATDADGDGLNDTCEQRYFGNLTATNNASGDPDGDTLTNSQECDRGTDPTKADTDGDGIRDDQDPAPTVPASSSNSTTTSRSNTTTSGNGTTSRSSTTTAGNVTTTDDSIDSLDEAIEKLRSDIGYLGGSAGAFLAVLVLCILALAVRWSL